MTKWNELFEKEEYRWREPDVNVAKFVKYLKEKGSHKILDLGCGVGRHIVYLSKEGFSVWGTDVSSKGLKYAREWLREEEIKVRLKKSDMTKIPFPDEYFDGVISVNVLHHNVLPNVKKAVVEIERVTKKGGVVLLTLVSTRDYKYGSGNEIEKNTFIVGKGFESGEVHHFFDKREVKNLLRRFKVMELKHSEKRAGAHLHAHWVILAELAKS